MCLFSHVTVLGDKDNIPPFLQTLNKQSWNIPIPVYFISFRYVLLVLKCPYLRLGIPLNERCYTLCNN